MLVKELIEILEEFEESDLVVLSNDEEGNGYRKLEQVDLLSYYDGEVGIRKLTANLKTQGYSDEDVLDYGENCAVFY